MVGYYVICFIADANLRKRLLKKRGGYWNRRKKNKECCTRYSRIFQVSTGFHNCKSLIYACSDAMS